MIQYRIHGTTAENLKEKITSFDFYSRELEGIHLKLKPRWTEAGVCPFHQDNKKGSFYVNLQNGAYRCFSCGAKGGDIIRFVQERYQVDFKDAMQKLRNDWGL